MRGVVTHPKHTVELFALTDYSGIGAAVPEDALKCVAFANDAPYSFADNAIAAPFADPEHAGALLADPNYTFEIVAESLGASAINRVSTHPWEKLAFAGDTEVAIAYSHHPASRIRLADNTDIAAAATLDTDAIRIVDRDDCGMLSAMTDGIYRLGVRAFSGNSCIVPARAEDAMEISRSFLRPRARFCYHRGRHVRYHRSPKLRSRRPCEFTFDAGHFGVRRCS